MKNYQVTEIELYLSEVGDGDPDLQFTPQEESTNVKLVIQLLRRP